MANARKRLVTQKADPDNVKLLSDGDVLSEVTEWIPTGFPGLDYILGGGWAVGRCSEVFGPEGAGKSALTHCAIKACQDNGGTVIYIDFENALDPPKMEQLGIDPKRLLYVRPDHIEQAWDIIWNAIDYAKANPPKAPILIVWDSVAASVPKAEIDEKSSDKSHVGLIARAMSKGCRKMFRRIPQVRAHMMWVNQERDNIGGGMFAEATTPGGRAVRYAASMRVRVTRVATMPKGKDQVKTHYLIRALTKKCRLFPPHRKMTWVLDFKHGPSPDLTLFLSLLDERVIKTSGGLYQVPWSKKKFKKSKWLERMEDEGFRARAEDTHKAIIHKELEKEPDEDAEDDEGGE